MNREEAAEFTRKLLEMAEINAFPGKPKRINNIPVFYFETVLSALSGPQPDPITGLAPCGCGGKAEQMDFRGGRAPHSKVECLECGIEIMRAGYTIAEAHDMAMIDWNASHGYTAPPRPGAIGTETGDMAPNGDEGAEL